MIRSFYFLNMTLRLSKNLGALVDFRLDFSFKLGKLIPTKPSTQLSAYDSPCRQHLRFSIIPMSNSPATSKSITHDSFGMINELDISWLCFWPGVFFPKMVRPSLAILTWPVGYPNPSSHLWSFFKYNWAKWTSRGTPNGFSGYYRRVVWRWWAFIYGYLNLLRIHSNTSLDINSDKFHNFKYEKMKEII